MKALFIALLSLITVTASGAEGGAVALLIDKDTPEGEVVARIAEALDRDLAISELEQKIDEKIPGSRPKVFRLPNLDQRAYQEAMGNFLHMMETAPLDMSIFSGVTLHFSDLEAPFTMFCRSGTQFYLPASTPRENLEAAVQSLSDQLASVEWREGQLEEQLTQDHGYGGEIHRTPNSSECVNADMYLSAMRDLASKALLARVGNLQDVDSLSFTHRAVGVRSYISPYDGSTNLVVPLNMPDNVMAHIFSAVDNSRSVGMAKRFLERQMRSRLNYRGNTVGHSIYDWGRSTRFTLNLTLALAQIEGSNLDMGSINDFAITDTGMTRAYRDFGSTALLLNPVSSAGAVAEDIQNALDRIDEIAALEQRVRQKTPRWDFDVEYDTRSPHADPEAYLAALERLERVAGSIDHECIALRYTFEDGADIERRWLATNVEDGDCLQYVVPVPVDTPEESLTSFVSAALERYDRLNSLVMDLEDTLRKHSGENRFPDIYNVGLDREEYEETIRMLLRAFGSVDTIPGFDRAVTLLLGDDPIVPDIPSDEPSAQQINQGVDAFRVYLY